MAISSLGQSIPVDLRREGYRGRGALGWVQTAQFAAISGRAAEFLHPDEQGVLGGFRFEKRQTSYLLGRYAAKTALGGCIGPGFEASRASVVAGVFGQPVVQYPTPRPFGVSITHSDRLVCALAFPEEHPMAIDVEELDEARTQVMLTQIGDEEGNLARSVCRSADLAATVVWTAKEALSKVLRCGLTSPFEGFAIAGLEERGGLYAGRFQNFSQYQFQSWLRQSTVVTIVLPKRTEMELALPDFAG